MARWIIASADDLPPPTQRGEFTSLGLVRVRNGSVCASGSSSTNLRGPDELGYELIVWRVSAGSRCADELRSVAGLHLRLQARKLPLNTVEEAEMRRAQRPSLDRQRRSDVWLVARDRRLAVIRRNRARRAEISMDASDRKVENQNGPRPTDPELRKSHNLSATELVFQCRYGDDIRA